MRRQNRTMDKPQYIRNSAEKAGWIFQISAEPRKNITRVGALSRITSQAGTIRSHTAGIPQSAMFFSILSAIGLNSGHRFSILDS
jgi:hypothetical protein